MRKLMLRQKKESTYSGIAHKKQNRDSKSVVVDLDLGQHPGNHSL